MSIRKLAIATTLATLALSFDCAAADAWRVTATLLHAGKPIATPIAVVEAGKPATVEVGGSKGYKLSIQVDELAEGKLQVDAGLVSAYGTMSPVLVVVPGQPATVNVGDLGMVVTVARQTD